MGNKHANRGTLSLSTSTPAQWIHDWRAHCGQVWVTWLNVHTIRLLLLIRMDNLHIREHPHGVSPSSTPTQWIQKVRLLAYTSWSRTHYSVKIP